MLCTVSFVGTKLLLNYNIHQSGHFFLRTDDNYIYTTAAKQGKIRLRNASTTDISNTPVKLPPLKYLLVY